MAEREPKPTDDDGEKRSGTDRRKPRSTFVERIGKARNRRSGKDRRSDDSSGAGRTEK